MERATRGSADAQSPRKKILSAAVVVLLVVLTAVEIHGFRSAELFSQDIWTELGLTRLATYTAVFFGAALLVAVLAPGWLLIAALAAAIVLTSLAVGVKAWIAALFVWISAEALGAKLLPRGGEASLEARVVGGLVGFGVYVFAMAFLVRLRVNFSWVYAAILAIPILTDVSAFRRRAEMWVRMVHPRRAPSWLERAGLLLLLYVLGLSWLLVLKPEISTDALAMHLAIPAGIDRHHVMPFEPDRFVWSVMPMGADYSYTLGYVLGGEAASRLVNFEMFLAIAALYFSAIRRWVSREVAFAFTACLAATPLSSMTTGSLFVENQQAALILGMLVSVWRLDETRHERWLHAAAVLGGTAVATKLGSNSFVACTLPFAALAVANGWRAMGPRPLLSTVASVGVLLAMGATPYAIAWWKTANPVFPFLNAEFRSPFFPIMNFADLSFTERVGIDSIYSLTFETPKWLASQRGAFGFQYLIFVVLALLASAASPRRQVLSATTVGIVGAYLILRSVPNARYVYPALPLISVAPAALLGSLGRHAWPSRAVVSSVIACTGMNVYFFVASCYYDKDFYVPFSAEARREYVRRTAPIREVVDYFNRTHPGEPVLFSHTTAVAGLWADAYEVQWHQWLNWDKVKAAADIPALRSLLATWKVHYLVAPAEGPDFEELPPVLSAFITNCCVSEFGVGDVYAARIESSCSVRPKEQSVGVAAARMGISGTLAVTPVAVCERTNVGSTVVSWTVSGTTKVEVRVGSPSGALLSATSGDGSQETENWVSKGTHFYLQIATDGVPRTLDYTLARVVARETVSGPCR
jgi:hypothetical protein